MTNAIRAASRLLKPAPIVAAVLIGLYFAQGLYLIRQKSATSDEAPHIAAGLSYLEKHSFNPNTQHPPLMKELAAACLLASGVRLPPGLKTDLMLEEPPRVAIEWEVGADVISAAPLRVMFRARLPILVVSTLLGVLLYLWGSKVFGTGAALGAVFVFAFDPIMLAHSGFVTTDMGLAVFSTLFFFTLWHYLRRPTNVLLVLSGVTMGLMLCAKFSGVFMIPVAGFLIFLSRNKGIAGVPAGAAMIRRLGEFALTFLTICIAAACTILLIYRSFHGVSMYWAGLNNVYADAAPGYRFYFNGMFDSRFPGYFAVAWLLKEPVAAVLLALGGALLLIRSNTLAWPDKLFFFLPPIVFFLAATFFAADIGVRYIIPALPFACLLGGFALDRLAHGSRPALAAAAVCCFWIVFADAGIFPDQLPYFNETACLLKTPSLLGFDGGTRCGPQWFDDSNVEWGQALIQLRSWLAAHPGPEPHLSYLVRYPSPAAYGIDFQGQGFSQFDRNVPPGRYIVSAHFVARHGNSWLTSTPPTAIVGHSLYVYDIR